MHFHCLEISKSGLCWSTFCALVLTCAPLKSSDAQFRQFAKDEIDLTVETRRPKDFYTQGIEKGGFIIHPQVSARALYDSNVLAQENNEQGDLSLTISPSVDIYTEVRDHSFLLELESDVERFSDLAGENNESYSAIFKGNIVGNTRWSFPLLLSHEKLVRERTRPLVRQTADERLDVRQTKASLGVKRKFNRLSLALLGNYTSLDNEDGIGLDKQTGVIFSDKDRDIYGGTLQLTYDFPRYKRGIYSEHVLFTNLTYANNEYKNRQFRNNNFSGPLADFTEYGFLAGFKTTFKGLLFADIGAGMTHQSYDDPALKDANTFNVSALVNYNLTPKLTLNINALRDVDPNNGLVKGVVTSDYGFGGDYELRHNLYLGGNIGYTNYDFDEIGRTDHDYHGSIYLKHYHSKNLESIFSLGYQDRQSNFVQRDFDRLELMFRLTGKL